MNNPQNNFPPTGKKEVHTIPGVDETHTIRTSQPVGEPIKQEMPPWLRTGLIGLGVAVILFFAGFLTDHFARYQPMKENLQAEIAHTQGLLSEANQQIASLQGQLLSANDQLGENGTKINTLETEKTRLEKDLEAANTHVLLLATIREIQTAHIALASGDATEARVALNDTAQHLETLKPTVATMDATLAENMSTRLNLALSGMETDPETAKADLGLLSRNLQNVEALLY